MNADAWLSCWHRVWTDYKQGYVIADWFSSSAAQHSNVTLNKCILLHLFVAIKQRAFIVGYIKIHGVRRKSQIAVLLFFSYLSVLILIRMFPSLICLFSNTLSCVLSILEVSSHALGLTGAFSATVQLCASMLIWRQHMAHSLFKLSCLRDSKPLSSPSCHAPYLPLLDPITLIS